MQDLELAKNRLSEENLTLSIVKDANIIFESDLHGISGFIEAIEKLGEKLEDASVADRVVGKAIALLCVDAKVKAVYASTLSNRAKALLEKYGVYYEWKNLVERILDINGKETCPFEKLAMEISNPNEAYKKFKDLQSALLRGNKNE
jgi:hypothetical protein